MLSRKWYFFAIYMLVLVVTEQCHIHLNYRDLYQRVFVDYKKLSELVNVHL